jgi:hypothetical protein
VTYEQTAEDLAACFYAASLIPDPTLEPSPDARDLDRYRRTGRELMESVTQHDRRLAKIRCTCATRTTHPQRHSRVIATVHDKRLVLVKGPRGPVIDGLRLTKHHLIDIKMARRRGFKSASVWCYDCGALHELGFRWLTRARLNEVSTPTEKLEIGPWGEPIAQPGYTPRHPDDPDQIAFAVLTGNLDSDDDDELAVTLGWRYAFDYRHHFGFQPPHDDHLFRLVNWNDERVVHPRMDLLPPQWWKLKHDPEYRAQEHIEGPLPDEAIAALAEYLREPDTTQEDLLTFEQIMDPPDFDRLSALLNEDTQ